MAKGSHQVDLLFSCCLCGHISALQLIAIFEGFFAFLWTTRRDMEKVANMLTELITLTATQVKTSHNITLFWVRTRLGSDFMFRTGATKFTYSFQIGFTCFVLTENGMDWWPTFSFLGCVFEMWATSIWNAGTPSLRHMCESGAEDQTAWQIYLGGSAGCLVRVVGKQT